MKHKSVLLLGLLLLANAGLLASYLHRSEKAPSAAPPASDGPGRELAPPPDTAPAKPEAPSTAPIWAQLHSDDPRTFAGRLRAAGVPARTARLLVSSQLQDQYLQRQRELIGTASPESFWSSASAAADHDKQAALRRLSAEQAALLDEIFGPVALPEAERERLRRLHGPLLDEKLERIERIESDYGAMAADLRLRTGGVLMATDREILAVLEQEKRKDIAAILTVEELELHDLQSSPAARSLRARLAAFAPTEGEFRALYAAQCAYDQQCTGAASGSAEEQARVQAEAGAAFETRIAQALGAARYAEFRRQQQPEYRVAARIAERFGLPVRRAEAVCALTGDTRARLATLRDDQTLEPATVHRALVALARETDEKLVALLTADGAELFKQTSSGAWLRGLERVEDSVPSVPGVALPNG